MPSAAIQLGKFLQHLPLHLAGQGVDSLIFGERAAPPLVNSMVDCINEAAEEEEEVIHRQRLPDERVLRQLTRILSSGSAFDPLRTFGHDVVSAHEIPFARVAGTRRVR